MGGLGFRVSGSLRPFGDIFWGGQVEQSSVSGTDPGKSGGLGLIFTVTLGFGVLIPET